jgi:hypothetical protein
MDNLIDLIKSSKWAPRTIKSRVSFLNTLKKNLDKDSDSISFLKDFNLISKYILKTYDNPSTKKNKILDIKSYLKLLDDTKTLKRYDNLINTLINENETYKGDNTVKDKDKWISYEELLEIPYIIEDDIKYVYGDLFLSDDQIDKLNSKVAKYKYLRSLTNYIIAVWYSWQAPVRADLATVLLRPSKTENYYDYNKGIIHYNNFKNVKSFGTRSFVLDKELKKIMDNYISILNYIIDRPDNLIYQISNSTIKVFSREVFSSYFVKIMNKYIGKKISINNVRHIFESHIINHPNYNKLTINEKKDIHDRLLHSFTTAQQYLKVDN